MFTQMLVPLDGSETAEKALPYSRYLAGKLKIPVRLLAVLDMTDTANDITQDRDLGVLIPPLMMRHARLKTT